MKLIIAGGGTGGHVFPAIAIANAVKAAVPDADILFVGAKDKLEMEKVPAAGYQIIGLWISGFQRKLSARNLSFPFKVVHSMIKARSILSSFKPDIVVGVGGYASGPILKAAAQKGIPVVIQEQNSYAGVTNRLLARSADAICVAYDGMEKFFPKEKIILTGNPVRSDVAIIEGKKPEACKFFGIDASGKTIVILGGSLGALTLNDSVRLAYEFLKQHSELQLIWQCGKTHYEAFRETDVAKLPNVKIMPFIERMDLAYAAADVLIARAGALTVSELCLVEKPVILVPSPNVAEDHQTRNALALVKNNAAILVRDSDARTQLFTQAFDLLNDPDKCRAMSVQIGLLARPDAARDIAQVIISKAMTR